MLPVFADIAVVLPHIPTGRNGIETGQIPSNSLYGHRHVDEAGHKPIKKVAKVGKFWQNRYQTKYLCHSGKCCVL
jgi:hypothetical protein